MELLTELITSDAWKENVYFGSVTHLINCLTDGIVSVGFLPQQPYIYCKFQINLEVAKAVEPRLSVTGIRTGAKLLYRSGRYVPNLNDMLGWENTLWMMPQRRRRRRGDGRSDGWPYLNICCNLRCKCYANVGTQPLILDACTRVLLYLGYLHFNLLFFGK